ncbi:hypothetical protein [Streptomyces shaanxiensis]|uniref:Zinc ribbon domain-containing protein n=1 Tax=Streptomyces shaanxiensis TaxID=653357 RepID=A0ABP7UET2_9ACTN
MKDQDPLFAAAREVRPFLTDLLSEGATEVDELLATALLSTRSEFDRLSRLQEVFASDDRLIDWVGQFLAAGLIPPEVVGQVSRGSGPVTLSGDPGRQPGVRFTCPNGDYTRYLLRRGEFVPPCPTCGKALVRAE